MPKNYQTNSHYWAQLQKGDTVLVPVFYTDKVFTYHGVWVQPIFVGDKIDYPKVEREITPDELKQYKAKIQPIITQAAQLVLDSNLTVIAEEKFLRKDIEFLINLINGSNAELKELIKSNIATLVHDYSVFELFIIDDVDFSNKKQLKQISKDYTQAVVDDIKYEGGRFELS